MLGEDEVQQLAERAHHRYRSRVAAGSEAAGRPFEALSDRMQEANRHAARFMPTIVAALGYTLRREPTGGTVEWTAEEIEAAARLEHLRWQRFTRWAGPRDHPDLRPWSELTEPVRDLDRMRVRDIPLLLAGVGVRVVPAEQPAPPGATG